MAALARRSGAPTVAVMRPLDLALPCLALLAADLGAAVWIGGASADWNHPDNWVGGTLPGSDDPVWDIPAGATVTLTGGAAGAEIIKRGDGWLRVGAGLAPTTAIEVEAGGVTWIEPLSLGHLRLAGGRAEGAGLTVGLLSVAGAGDAWLGDLPGLEAGTLRMEGPGTLGWEASARVGALEILGGRVDLGSALISGPAWLSGGELVGGVVSGLITVSGGVLGARVEGELLALGYGMEADNLVVGGITVLAESAVGGNIRCESEVWIAIWAGWSRVEGRMELGPDASLHWWIEHALSPPPLVVAGELIAGAPVPVEFGEVDWTNSYWDEARELLLVDAWEGGIVNASFAIDPATGDAEGSWEQERGTDGDLIMRWTPAAAAAAAIPESSTFGSALALAALALALSVRRRRAGPR